jgi:hypothetical protein
MKHATDHFVKRDGRLAGILKVGEGKRDAAMTTKEERY